MVIVFLGLLLGLHFKHFVADYLLQSGWIIAGKGSLRAPGGYAHAGIHAAFSLVVLLVCGTPVLASLAICVAEFVVHYGLDYAKIHYSRGVHADTQAKRYWGLHGLDQLFHQITYAAMILAALAARGSL